MIAYKFLSAGRVGPFTRYEWPVPGAWVSANAGVQICLDGVHACRARDLPLWLDDELWEVELDGRVVERGSKLAAERGRLVRRVHAWSAGTAGDLSHACALRARDHALWALRRTNAPAELAEPLAQAFTARAITEAAESAEAHAAPLARLALGFAADTGEAALGDACAEAAYVVAHAAGRLRGPAWEAAERRWQADWLIDRLDLGA